MIESYFDARNIEVASIASVFSVFVMRPAVPDKYGDYAATTENVINCRYVPNSERFVGKNVQGEDETLTSRAILYVKPGEDIEVGDRIRIQFTTGQSGSDAIHHELLTVRRKEALKDFQIVGWKVYLT